MSTNKNYHDKVPNQNFLKSSKKLVKPKPEGDPTFWEYNDKNCLQIGAVDKLGNTTREWSLGLVLWLCLETKCK